MIDNTTAAIYIPLNDLEGKTVTLPPAESDPWRFRYSKPMHPLEMMLADLPEIYTIDLLKTRIAFARDNQLSMRCQWAEHYLKEVTHIQNLDRNSKVYYYYNYWFEVKN